MKKFCTTCGNQLELSQKFCSQCGTVNPFFVQAFTFISDQSEKLEKLRLEKERIEKELLEKEAEQAEFARQEMLKKQKEEEERQKAEKSAAKKHLKESSELDKDEHEVKKALLRVKEETEKYKLQTDELVREVREGLKQIGEDNRKLKLELETLKAAPERELDPHIVPGKQGKASALPRFLILLLAVLFVGTAGSVAYMLLNRPTDSRIGDSNPETTLPKDAIKPVAQVTELPMDTTGQADSSLVAADTIQQISTGATQEAPKVVNAAREKTDPPKPKQFAPTASKIKNDLVNKNISGCDLTIDNTSEIVSVSNISLIEKLPTGFLKYKISLRITKDGEEYNAVPYMYYTSDGIFIKVDGTNCE